MTTLTNERKQFDIKSESNNLTLTGSVIFSGKGEVKPFTGNIYGKGNNVGDSFGSNFTYSETGGVIDTFNMNDIPLEHSEEARTLITTTVNDIKQQLNSNEDEEG